MNHEDSHIIATCAKCDFRFDILFGVFCPRCRERAVRLAFSPVDPQRTALGMGIDAQAWEQSKKDNNYYWHGKENPGREHWQAQADWASKYMGSKYMGRPSAAEDVPEPLPEGMKMPVSTVDQIYELKRMRRLIGKL